MSYQTGTATSYLDLLNQLRSFLTGVGSAGAPSFTGTGNGTMTGVTCYPGTKTETITVKCTSAATPGAEVWSVTGSVSGALASATTGVTYTSSPIGFKINAGATNFAVNDQFTIATTQGAMSAAGSAWTELKYSSASYASGQDTVDAETYLKAPGLSGTESIYINIRAFHYTASDYYNWEMRAAQGFNSSAIFTAQPGISPQTYVYLWNQSIPYWFIANGQRAIIVAKVSTVYEMAYLGKFLPYGTPGQYPYPVAVGGCGYANGDLRFSDTSWSHVAFFDPSGLFVCDPANAWQQFQDWNTGGSLNPSPNNVIWPYVYYGGNRPNWMSANLDGGYTIFPLRLQQSSPSLNILGELDGVGFVTGNANSSESTVNDGTNNWIVVQNVFRTSADNYCAVKMA
jgi:hypothetical protein